MNIYLISILVILAGEYLLDLAVEFLNIRNASPVLPEEFKGFYDTEKYKKSQDYLKDKTGFELIKDGFFTLVIITFILAGGFNYIDKLARSFLAGPILTGLLFAGIILLASQILSLPFSVYNTFSLEEKYGFNRTTLRTFVLDRIKGLFLSMVIGGIIFAAVLWFFAKFGTLAWIYSWMGVILFELFLTFIAPVWIMPLFNKFIPLEEGDLKKTIEQYAGSQDFKLQGIFKIDASRRSSKSNAFFTGFGKYRRIALFDTLIEKHTVDELVSVLAHEVGHYKKKHVIKNIFFSIMTTGILFFIMSFFLNNPGLFEAFKMEKLSVYAGIIFFGFLYAPINSILSVIGSFVSRKHEYAADAYAVTTYGKPEEFILALKKLTVDNLSNLTPHPLKVALYYSHPPVLKRIEAIRKMELV